MSKDTNLLNALSMEQLGRLERANINQDNIIYVVHVTGMDERERRMQDIPETYLVKKNEQANGGCIVYGWHGRVGEWYVNPSLRWLVRHFAERENKI